MTAPADTAHRSQVERRGDTAARAVGRFRSDQVGMILNQLFGSYSKDIELRAADDKTEVLEEATDLGRQAGLIGLIISRPGFALDRKSWLFAGSDHSGERSSKARVRLFPKPFSGPERCRFHDPARTRRSQRMI
jgi:hypothetical protein